MKNYTFYVYNAGNYEKFTSLDSAVTRFQDITNSDNCYKALGVEKSDFAVDVAVEINGDVKISNDLFSSSFKDDKMVTCNLVRILKSKLNIQLEQVEQMQNDLENYDSYELYDEYSDSGRRLMVLNEKGSDFLIINVTDNDGSAVGTIEKSKFMNMCQFEFDVAVGEIIHYNFVFDCLNE